jgi:hypothetical protein
MGARGEARGGGAMTCIFCGTRNPVHGKSLHHSFVFDMVQRQMDAGINEAIVNHMCSVLAAMKYEHTQADIAQSAGDADGAEEEQEEGFNVCSCMCCYYWVSRRRRQQLVPFPMQNLLWFVRTLTGCESKKCDSRILLRLVRTIIIEGNMYSMFFEHCELEGMREIVKIADEQASQIYVQYDSKGKLRKKRKSQGNALFCVKEHLAQLWHLNNGQSILLPHRQATDLLR